MRAVLAMLPLLACACSGAPPPTAAQMSGFRASSSTETIMPASGGGGGAPVTLGQVGTPLAGISVACRPDPSGLNASCRTR